MFTEKTLDLKIIAKAEAFDQIVDARRKVLAAASACTSGGGGDIVAGLEAFSVSTREFAAFVESLCDKAIWGSLDAAEGSLGKSFEEFWTSKHGECAPNSVVILKVPNKSGRGA
jgi:hypothetical protein